MFEAGEEAGGRAARAALPEQPPQASRFWSLALGKGGFAWLLTPAIHHEL